MSFAIGVVVFIVGVLVSIALHEVGHLAPAKRFGVKVPEYFVGFGPTLWSRRRGETEYGLKAIPLGGYVRLAGMYPPAKRAPVRDARGRLSLIEEAREEARSDLQPGEEGRAFSALTVPKKLAVMFGGPLMNWLIALVLFVVVMAGFGSPGATSTLGTVGACVPAAGTSQCSADDPVSPAAAAGLEPGDRIVSWGGAAVDSWEQVQSLIRDGGTAPVAVVVERDGAEQTLTVTPALTERVVTDDAGVPILDSAGNTQTEQVPYVGISPTLALIRGSVGDGVSAWWGATGQTFAAIATIPSQLWGIATGWFGGESGDRTLLSIVGVGQVAGSIAAEPSASFSLLMRVRDMVALLASLNLALFVFNLIPLPPLDGGHIAGALVEGARNGWARLRRVASPGPVDMARTLPLAYGVFGVLVVMSVILIAADIVDPITL